jgi:hypothetical protein
MNRAGAHGDTEGNAIQKQAAALAYARRGLPVLPCKPRGKNLSLLMASRMQLRT